MKLQHQWCQIISYIKLETTESAVVAQSVRAFAPQAEGWVFESQP